MSESIDIENGNKYEWTVDSAIRLIEAYERYPLLWNPREKLYRNKYKRNDALIEIASDIGCNVLDLKKKLESILAQYRREKKNVTKSGMATNDKKKPWWGIKYLRFLDDKYTPNRTTSSSDTLLNSEEDNIDAEVSQTAETQGDIATTGDKPSPSKSEMPPNKKSRKSKQDQAYQIMKECYEGMNSLESHRDEFSVYGEAVAARIRKLTNPMSICILKNKIDNAIFEAEMEEYKSKSYSVSCGSTPAPSSSASAGAISTVEDSRGSGFEDNMEGSMEENDFNFLRML